MINMKKLAIIMVMPVVFVFCAGSALANLISNGDFGEGNSGFGSDYSTGDLHAAYRYGIGTNPNTYHSSWASFQDHTTGSGNMMIVNGGDGSQTITTFWNQTVALTAGTTYNFSVWVASSYSANPANLELWVNNVLIDSFIAPSTTGSWTEFKANWTASDSGSFGLRLVDTSTAYSGNDFAIDDLKLTAVPISPTIWLLGSGLLGLVGLRRRLKSQ